MGRAVARGSAYDEVVGQGAFGQPGHCEDQLSAPEHLGELHLMPIHLYQLKDPQVPELSNNHVNLL